MPLKNLNKKEYISLTEATKYCDCTRQYLSLRARQGKLKAEKIGRNWVTTKEWVEEYFGKTNSPQVRAQEKKANGFSSLASRYFSVVKRLPHAAVALLAMTKGKPELRYAIAIVLVFVFLGAGFIYAGPTLSVTKDLFLSEAREVQTSTLVWTSERTQKMYHLKGSFVEGLVVFSEETGKGVSKFSQDAGEVPNTLANFSNMISENFPSTTTGARAVVQNFCDGKNYVIHGVENIAVGTANVPVKIARGVSDIRFLRSPEIGYPKQHIDSAKYGLGYTGRMVEEYTQWLNQKFVPESLYTAKENVELGAASVLNSCELFYNKYDSKLFK